MNEMFFSREELVRMLPVVISDLKHEFEPENRVRNNKNIQNALYKHVIRELYSEGRFAHKEVVGHGEGLFIKGYVRDVWKYLDEAYDLIHNLNYEVEYAELILEIK